jgi:3',5'-cyclic AMP phosphodiesterase CpdA
MSGGIVHLTDPHFGPDVNLSLIHAIEDLIPDLEPRLTVISGDLTQRARHGELLAARAFVRELERSAPVVVIPGNHDVQWWWRPLLPFGRAAKYAKYVHHFGPVLTPTLSLPDVLVTSLLTSHGIAWGSLTTNVRDTAVKGHLSAKELQRAKEQLAKADRRQLKVLVIHHNVTRGEISQRMGLARWKQAQRRIAMSGAELVLCGHDHQESLTQLRGKAVVSCAGSLCARSQGDRPAVFHRMSWDDRSIEVEQYRWDVDRRVFVRADIHVFARPTKAYEPQIPAHVG